MRVQVSPASPVRVPALQGRSLQLPALLARRGGNGARRERLILPRVFLIEYYKTKAITSVLAGIR
jgi:hypothetical protein